MTILPTKAMVLGAGLGKRSRPLTVYHAKPALPLMGRPIIEYLLRRLARQGVREVVVNLHHRPESVEPALAAAPPELVIRHSLEPELLGTAGGLKRVERHFACEEAFLLLNGDTLTDFDMESLARTHEDTGAAATLLLRPRPPGSAYSNITLGRDRRIEAVTRSKRAAGDGGELMFAGVWMLSPRVLARLSGRPAGLETELLPALIREGEAAGDVQQRPWISIDTPFRYWAACLTMAREGLFEEDWAVRRQRANAESTMFTGPGTRIGRRPRARGEIVMGSGCRLETGARVERVVCWDGVVIPKGTELTDSVVTEGVTVPGGRELERRLIMRVGDDDRELRRREIDQGLVVTKLKRERERKWGL